MTSPVIMWFRQDLRVHDNPALKHACEQGEIIPVYILDDHNAQEWKMGGASRVWLHHSLKDLNTSLNGNLHVFSGNAKEILEDIVKDTSAVGIYWNRCYEPWRIARDKDIKAHFLDKELDVESFNGSLLWEPWAIKKDDGTPYKVFTPFYKKGCLNAPAPREPISSPKNIAFHGAVKDSLSLSDLKLLPTINWDNQMVNCWDISENGAKERLHDFLDKGLDDYKEGRNFPAKDHVSRMSPYLHFGNISPHQVWYAAIYAKGSEDDKNLQHFLSELGWREFSHSLLYHFPDLPRQNLQKKFDNFPWKHDDNLLKLWQKGQTGYPIVDAGMRELWQTGYMHNRVRMIVGSFLVKNLLISWHHGEDWFWDCLFDANLANNSASWQWIAGSGADAAPYFRIFNPMTQSARFDEDGIYIKTYVPELKNMPSKHIHAPWEAPEDVLDKAGVKLGENYPYPIVDHANARDKALSAFHSLKEN